MRARSLPNRAAAPGASPVVGTGDVASHGVVSLSTGSASPHSVASASACLSKSIPNQASAPLATRGPGSLHDELVRQWQGMLSEQLQEQDSRIFSSLKGLVASLEANLEQMWVASSATSSGGHTEESVRQQQHSASHMRMVAERSLSRGKQKQQQPPQVGHPGEHHGGSAKQPNPHAAHHPGCRGNGAESGEAGPTFLTSSGTLSKRLVPQLGGVEENQDEDADEDEEQGRDGGNAEDGVQSATTTSSYASSSRRSPPPRRSDQFLAPREGRKSSHVNATPAAASALGPYDSKASTKSVLSSQVQSDVSTDSWRGVGQHIRRDDIHRSATSLSSARYPVGSKARRAVDKMQAMEETRRQAAYTNGLDDVPSEEASEHPLTWRERLRGAIQDVRFEVFIFVMILVNVVMVGIEVDNVSQGDSEYSKSVFLIFDGCFTTIFFLELCLRILAQGRDFFDANQRWWNAFDSFVVLVSLVELMVNLFLDGNNVNIEYMRFIRVARTTRVLRAVRLIRLVRFIRALRTLVDSIFATLKSLIWAMLLMLMILYGFALAITQTVAQHIEGEDEAADGSLVEYWGSLAESMFTLFKSITGGVSWHSVVEPLGTVGPFMVILFMIYITFTFFAVLNVITGVFCQSAIDSAAQDKDMITFSQLVHHQRHRQIMEELFKEIDKDNSGTITIQEFERYLSKEEVRAYFDSMDIDTSDAWMLFTLLDKDGEGSLDLQEFLDGCLTLKGGAKAIHMVQLQRENKWTVSLLQYFMEDVFAQLDHICKLIGKGYAPRSPTGRNAVNNEHNDDESKDKDKHQNAVDMTVFQV